MRCRQSPIWQNLSCWPALRFLLTASVGISMYPDDGEDIETLLRLADFAMYHVKSHGKNGLRLLQRHGDTSRRLLFENEIRHGLESREFELHDQRQVDSATRR